MLGSYGLESLAWDTEETETAAMLVLSKKLAKIYLLILLVLTGSLGIPLWQIPDNLILPCVTSKTNKIMPVP